MASVEVILISCPVIDWDNFINKTITHTGHIITTGIDASKLKLKHHPKYLAALGQLKEGKTIHPNKAPNTDAHLFFGFLIIADLSILLELADTEISTMIVKSKIGHLAIATGSLKQWQDVEIAGVHQVFQSLGLY